MQNHLYLRQQGDFSGVNEPPEGGEEAAQEQAAKARSSFTQSFLGEEWVEVEPGIYHHQPGPLFRTVDPAPDEPTIDEALGRQAVDVAGATEPAEAPTGEDSPEGILQRWLKDL